MASLSTTRAKGNPTSILRTIASYDWWLMLSTAVLIMFGLMSLYSINHSVPGSEFKRQLLNLAVGIVPFLMFLIISPATWRKLAPFLYCANLGFLVLVMLKGVKRGGDAQRWVMLGPLQFQPSEAAKILMILTLAAFWASMQDKAQKLSTFALSFLITAVPMVLIYKQPHLGATLAVFAMWLGISLAMGTRPRFIVASIGLGFAALAAAYFIPLLDEYQLNRIKGLLNPDSATTGYQLNRGLIATGVGGLTGAGFLKGDLKAAGSVPEQQTDFIVTVLGEEGGLVGVLLLLATYSVFFFRIWWIMIRAEDKYHRGILAGVLTVLSFHTVVNLGMVFGLLPVVGLWLPFMSYGGTAMWLCLACVGIALNIKAREDTSKF